MASVTSERSFLAGSPPAVLTKPSLVYVARRSVRGFSKDDCTDLAAALTYYGVLALFPAIVALLSLVGLVGQRPKGAETMLAILADLGGPSSADSLRPALTTLSQTPGAGLGFVLGVATALWAASGYVAAFGRAMNQIYEVGEGRPFWKLRPLTFVVTLVAVALCALVVLGLILSGPIAESVARATGLGSTAVLAWNIAKWPMTLLFVVLLAALLYHATPNVQRRFTLMSGGAFFAVTAWILASAAFGVYVANFASYSHTYGALAGVVVFLLWLWITNLALLFGAELDAELGRRRKLQAGIPAEESLYLAPRDTRRLEKVAAKTNADIERGRRLRMSRGSTV